MLRSLYSGISGMKVNQQKMDVIGNNIANVGTTAFKSSRARFQDMLSQSVSDAQGSSLNQGGVNPSQVGLGVKLAGIDTIMSQGMMQPTNRNYDVAVDGEGYFIVSKGPDAYVDGTILVDPSQGNHTINGSSLSTANVQIMYTRDGAFAVDDAGNLLTSDGYRVMGYSLTGEPNTIGGTGVAPVAVTVNGLTITPSAGSGLNGYTVNVSNITSDVTTATIQKYSAGPPVVPGVITVTGNSASPTFNQDIEDAINTALGSNGFPQMVNITGTITGTGTSPAFSNLGTPVQSIDSNNRINFVDAKGIVYSYDNNLKSLKIPDKVHDVATNTDLRVTSFTIDKTGVINATLEGGKQSAIGQIAMAAFNNTAGLKKLGKNLNEATVNSGAATVRTGVGTLGQDNSKGYGDQLQGMLEMSNVDLAEQFTDMIVATRAFEASGKMISTGDEILQTIIGLKR